MIRKRGKRLHYQFDLGGRTHCGSTGLEATRRNESAARLKEEEARQLILEGRDPKQRLTVVPFNDAVEQFLMTVEQQHQDHPNTAQRTRTSFVSLKAHFGNKMVSTLNAGDLVDYMTWRRSRQIKEVTIRKDCHAMSLFFQYAVRKGWSRDNLVRQIDMPSDRDSRRDNPLTTEQEKLYFAHAMGDLHESGRVMIMQGLRPDEVVTLQKDDLDVDRRTLTIRKGKTEAASRTIFLCAEALRILAYRLSSDGLWLFPSKRITGHHRGRLNTQHDALIKRLGLSFVLYDLRHTYGSRATMAGVDLATLCKSMGHSDISTTMRYVHPDQEHQRKAMDLIEAAYGNMAGQDEKVQ